MQYYQGYPYYPYPPAMRQQQPVGGEDLKFKQTGVYPQRQILSFNPPIEENPNAEYPKISVNAVVGPNSYIFGDVRVEDDCFIGWNNLIRADSSTPYFIGKKTNIQDFVVIHCHPNQHVDVKGKKYGVYIGDEVSILHHAQPHGPLYIGRNTFIGEGVSIYGATIGKNCVIMHGATVTNDVKISDGRFIEPGKAVWKQEQADALPPVPEKFKGLNQEIVDHYYRLGKSYRKNTPFFI
ncbi:MULTISPECIES: DapH/DapD/GlmU-related protein [Heyndrickxia]|uniref:DapH/DapD/GlmU-related protein n=1 Tax=Heyndrickxia TaxID=2837504 RepID=UPI0006EBEDFF|nr:DapH/DapD/GlmU-related protein [Heyndrickxia shackletonii]MBB2479950.1 carbonate dehydratase [Bacillus sp. APMAM]NEY98036.1 carbonate dehydratase [Heyndrickxia shackletonii]RTZ56637.1 carbonate dehydratase [Bacillus sp. SAJ1]